jgi:non-specific serine/threonine protein kinase/serine/threonine-protein kinase
LGNLSEIHAGGDNSPHKLSKRLQGDLDAIVLKALRKEAEQRYAAVELLSEDIRRELEGLPLTARKGSWNYRTRKFVRRNRIAVTAAMVVGIAILAGIAATVREARIASANAQRAERRFNDVRKLANSLIFEVHDSIQDLPGSTAARQIIIRDAVQYLDVLASESGNDVALQRELASAYMKLGTVQGNAVTGNLGDINGARRSYEKAISVLQLLEARDPGDAVTEKNLASAYGMLGDVMWDDSAPIYYAKALQIREKLTQQRPDDAILWGELAKGYQQATTLRINRHDFENAKELAQKSLAAAQRFHEARPGGTEAQSLISVGYTKLGIAQENLGQLDDALRSYTEAMEIDRNLAARSPDSGSLLRDVSLDWQSLARVKMARNDYTHALNDVLTAMAILERLSRQDPADKRTQYLLALTHECAGLALLKSKQYQSALNQYREALNICRCRSQWDAQNAPPAQLAGIVYKEIGDTYRALAKQASLRQSQREQFGRSACSSYVQSLAAFDHLSSIGSLNSWNKDTRIAAAQGLRECQDSSVN